MLLPSLTTLVAATPVDLGEVLHGPSTQESGPEFEPFPNSSSLLPPQQSTIPEVRIAQSAQTYRTQMKTLGTHTPGMRYLGASSM